MSLNNIPSNWNGSKKPTGDNARKGAVKKRSHTKTTLGGASAWTKRNKNSGESWP
jgi:hypothetical protein